MTLNRVDLPQPDGPITARNSPGAHVERDVVDGGEDAVRRVEMLGHVIDDEDAVLGLTRGRGGLRLPMQACLPERCIQFAGSLGFSRASTAVIGGA